MVEANRDAQAAHLRLQEGVTQLLRGQAVGQPLDPGGLAENLVEILGRLFQQLRADVLQLLVSVRRLLPLDLLSLVNEDVLADFVGGHRRLDRAVMSLRLDALNVFVFDAAFQPLVLEELEKGHALFEVLLEHAGEHVLELPRDLNLGELEFPLLDHQEQVVDVATLGRDERRLAENHLVNDDSD